MDTWSPGFSCLHPKIASSQLPYPRDVRLGHSPSTAAHSIYCSGPLVCFSIEASKASHCHRISVTSSLLSQLMSLDSGRMGSLPGLELSISPFYYLGNFAILSKITVFKITFSHILYCLLKSRKGPFVMCPS